MVTDLFKSRFHFINLYFSCVSAGDIMVHTNDVKNLFFPFSFLQETHQADESQLSERVCSEMREFSYSYSPIHLI